MEHYLIPANSKRSMLILGLFEKIDAIIFGSGVGTTIFLLMLTGKTASIVPGVVASIMVLPVPNHRNVWQLTANIFNYLTNYRSYYWRGWCVLDGEETRSEK